MPKLRFRAKTNIPTNPPIGPGNDIPILPSGEIPTNVIEPTISKVSVNVPLSPTGNWGNSNSSVGWVCANAPYPIGTGVGCYESIGGFYTNTNNSSPSYGTQYQLPCIPYFAGGSCFQYKDQGTGSPACQSFCLQS